MRRPDAAAQVVLRAFDGAGVRGRLHTAVRWWTCPFPLVAGLVPRDGAVLDLGCGHGLFSMYLALDSPGRTVLGVDIDAAKIGIGMAAIARAGLADRVELRRIDPSWSPDPASFDAVVANDVLYLMGRRRAQSTIAAMAAALRPAGVVVLKEMASTPRWKYRVNETQERLATGALRLTAGSDLEVLSQADLEDPLRAAGLSVQQHRLDRGFPHPHLAIVGRAD